MDYSQYSTALMARSLESVGQIAKQDGYTAEQLLDAAHRIAGNAILAARRRNARDRWAQLESAGLI